MFDKWKRKPETDRASESNPSPQILRCSFCGKAQADVRKLIAAPQVFICDECVDVCNDIIADDERVTNPLPETQPSKTSHRSPPTKNGVACTLCGNIRPPIEMLAIGSRGVLCAECADAVEDALDQGRPIS